MTRISTDIPAQIRKPSLALSLNHQSTPPLEISTDCESGVTRPRARLGGRAGRAAPRAARQTTPRCRHGLATETVFDAAGGLAGLLLQPMRRHDERSASPGCSARSAATWPSSPLSDAARSKRPYLSISARKSLP